MRQANVYFELTWICVQIIICKNEIRGFYINMGLLKHFALKHEVPEANHNNWFCVLEAPIPLFDLNTEVGKKFTPISPPHNKSISQLQQTCYLTHFLDLISLVVFLFSDYTYNNKLNFNCVSCANWNLWRNFMIFKDEPQSTIL